MKYIVLVLLSLTSTLVYGAASFESQREILAKDAAGRVVQISEENAACLTMAQRLFVKIGENYKAKNSYAPVRLDLKLQPVETMIDAKFCNSDSCVYSFSVKDLTKQGPDYSAYVKARKRNGRCTVWTKMICARPAGASHESCADGADFMLEN